MIEAQTLEFELMVGKKPAPEYQEALTSGYKEAYREAVKGGYKITLAKPLVALKGTSRVFVLLLDKMPPSELINKEFGLHSKMELKRPATKDKPAETLEGTYGLCDGRKFFTLDDGKKPVGRPKKSVS